LALLNEEEGERAAFYSTYNWLSSTLLDEGDKRAGGFPQIIPDTTCSPQWGHTEDGSMSIPVVSATTLPDYLLRRPSLTRRKVSGRFSKARSRHGFETRGRDDVVRTDAASTKAQ